MNQNEINMQVNKQKEHAKVILDSINTQRKGAIETLEKKASSLLDNDKLNVENLGNPVTVSLARDLVQSVNSTLIALESHDKLMDMIIGDLMAVLQQMDHIQTGLFHVSMSTEAMMKLLVAKNVLEEEELKQAHEALYVQAKQALEEAKKNPSKS